MPGEFDAAEFMYERNGRVSSIQEQIAFRQGSEHPSRPVVGSPVLACDDADNSFMTDRVRPTQIPLSFRFLKLNGCQPFDDFSGHGCFRCSAPADPQVSLSVIFLQQGPDRGKSLSNSISIPSIGSTPSAINMIADGPLSRIP